MSTEKKQPMPLPLRIPIQWLGFIRWLLDRRGIDLHERVKINGSVWIGKTEITPEVAEKIVALVEGTNKKNPRNKHPAKSRAAPAEPEQPAPQEQEKDLL